MRSIFLAGAAAVMLGLGAAPTAVEAASASSNNCFLSSEWTGWKAPAPDVIYLRVNLNRIFRLDLSSGSSQLQDPDVHLVSRIEGSDWICTPLDLQLEVADLHGGFREPLIVKKITLLTPEEAKAIPPKFRP